jgi:hypothetical protein
MTAPALVAVLQRVCAVLPGTPVKVGVEAAGHYHRPLLEPGGVAHHSRAATSLGPD